MLNPRDADNLTKGVIQSLQGDDASIVTLVDQTSRLTDSFAGRDEELGEVITDLNVVVDNLAQHNDSLDEVITQTREVVSTFDARRPELVRRWDPSPGWCASCPPSPTRSTRR